MRINARKILNIILSISLIGYILNDWYNTRSLSFEQAGTDFTKAYNFDRRRMNLPIIPYEWTPANPLKYKIQTWENPDTLIPSYSEKTVVASPRAEFVSESDRYNLKKIGDNFYQIVIDYYKTENKWFCTLRVTQPPEKTENLKGIRYAGTILSELTLDQALDTLKMYGIERLNY